MLGLGTGLTSSEYIWLPTDVAGLLMWLTARTGDLTLDGSAVTTWTARFPTDGSYAFTQATAVNKPVFDVDKVTFDASGGDDDILLEADTKTTLDTSATGWTVAMQVTCSNWDEADQVFIGEKDSNFNMIRHASGTNTISVKASNQFRHFTLDSGLTDNTYYHIMLTCDTSGNLVLYIDNVAQADTESFSATDKDFIFDEIGGKNGLGQALTGSFKEIIIFEENLSTANRLECYNYMK